MAPRKAAAQGRARRAAAALGPDALYEYAVRSLAYQACSSDALRSKLRGKTSNAADIEATLARLREVGYLDDQKFAESFATVRADHDGFGRMRVLSDLRARRVPAKVADAAVEQAFAGKSEGDMIDSYIERRMPSLAAGGKIEDDKELGRAYRRLRRAGFSSSGVLAALKRLAVRPELLDEPSADEEEADLSA